MLGILIRIVRTVMAVLSLVEVLQWVVEANFGFEKVVVIHQVFETPDEIDQYPACSVGDVIDLVEGNRFGVWRAAIELSRCCLVDDFCASQKFRE